ncbi:MAG: four-carbon acid sugar kinase family protein [Alphaproteobacteria bacterium]|nr:four-carbon acid sugar kinase family protein [Alphaproteobacteria bacterium]
MSVLLGCIADDSTGATDLANTLVKQGMRTVQLIGVPDSARPPDSDAVVVALKTRTCSPAEAVARSRAALSWLKRAGSRQFFFKYCSTFDSTAQGNIGPVAEALMADLGGGVTIACPAFPTNGRTVYNGYLFVGEVLLSESPMRHHPLTPMTDANLVRVLQAQSAGAVGLVPRPVVARGAEAVVTALAVQADGGHYCAVVDAIDDGDLLTIGEACRDLTLVTGGSGVATGLPENFRRRRLLREQAATPLPTARGAAAVLSGSCSAATLEQVRRMGEQTPAFMIDPLVLAARPDIVDAAIAWARPRLAGGPLLIYASAPPEQVARVQAELGRERAGALVERAIAAIARELVGAGVRRLVVAGGETAGAVLAALGVRGLRIGPEIDPGVPWTESIGEPPLALALKSGNFGGPDFFAKALRMLP